MVRSGKIDVVVLGAYQVDEAGNVANWSTPEQVGGGIGGAMDMVAGGGTVMVLMEHRDSRDRAKLVRSCTYPLTGAGCVDIVVTDLAVLRRARRPLRPGGCRARAFRAAEIDDLTEMDIRRRARRREYLLSAAPRRYARTQIMTTLAAHAP